MTDRSRRIAPSALLAALVIALIQSAVLTPMFLRERVSLAAVLILAVVVALHVGFNFYFRGVVYITGTARTAGWRTVTAAAVLVLYPQGIPFALSVTGPGPDDLGCLGYICVWWALVSIATLLLLKTDFIAATTFSFLAVFIMAIPTAIFAGVLIAMFAP